MSIDIPSLLDDLNRLDESPRIEAKAASEIGKSLMETVVAFANTSGMGGGTLLLGVEKEADLFGEPYVPTGVADPDRIMADLASQCASMLNVPVRPVMERATVAGRTVVGAFIPEAAPDQKPVYVVSQGLPKGARVRVGSTDQRCTDADLARFYQARSVRPFDDTLVGDTTLEDRSTQAIENYRRERRRRDPDAPELEWDDERLLRGLRLVRDDPAGVPRLTVAGVLLFGRAETVHDLFPAARVDYARVQGRTWIADARDRFTSLDLHGPIFEVIYRIENAIMDDLPVAFSLPEDSLHRVDKPLIPRDVVREALVNALMHRDYQAHSPVLIVRYSNRIEVQNKGYSLKPEEELGTAGSVLRNPKIADVLHQTRLAETKGSGIATMRQRMIAADLTPPTFASNRERNQFLATLLLLHFVTPENLAWLAHFGDLSRDDKQALVFVRETNRITNADYRTLNDTDTLTASQALRRLRDAGLLTQHDHGAATYYTPTDALLLPDQTPQEHPAQDSELPTQAGELTAQAERLTTQAPVPIPEASGAIPQPPHIRAAPSVWKVLPTELQEEVVRAGKRSTHRALRDLLLRLCGLHPWTADELADVLGRNRKHLTDRHLSQMVKLGLLTRTRRSPTDPAQAYTTAPTA